MPAPPVKPQSHRTVVKVDPYKFAWEQEGLFNRWHPDIPAYTTVKQDEIFKVECHEWTGGQIKNSDDADDIQNVDLTKIHYLSGPIAVEGAKAGDALVVDILEIQPFDNMLWAYTGVFERTNGGGLLSKALDSKAAKTIWDIEGIYATSRHVPGVRFAGIPHPGLMGTMPSQTLLNTWNKRERALIATAPDAVPVLALPPEPKGGYVGQKLAKDVQERILKDGARTIPPREHGGNVDIKNLSKGSRCFYPVYVDGANLGVGDLHFSQGDGELSFCGGAEMAGIITLRTRVIKDGIKKLNLKQPIFVPSPIDPMYLDQIIFQGISVEVNGDGSQHAMDATVAYKQAALNCIAYLRKLGYTLEQAHMLLSAAPVESHIGGIVDVPNACVTMGLPTQIFDRDIRPTDNGIEKRDYGNAAVRSDGVRCNQSMPEFE